MLRWRLFLGALFIAALVGLCWLDVQQALGLRPGGWLFPLALPLTVPACAELLRMVGQPDEKPSAWVVYIGCLAIVASNAVPLLIGGGAAPHVQRAEAQATAEDGGSVKGEALLSAFERLGIPVATLVIAVLAAFAVEINRYERPGKVVVKIALAIFCLVYVGLFMSFVIQLRMFPGNLAGMTALVSLIAVVKMGDTGAYFVGRIAGRNKMAPELSPGKTWEGALGGILFAAAAAWIVFRLVPTKPGAVVVVTHFRWEWLLYGVVVGLFGMLGDLAESMIKRDADCKDSGPWLPGFGGILDLLDSILFAAPVAWFLWAFELV